MSDLISRSALLNIISKMDFDFGNDTDDTETIIKMVSEVINDMPTAYDVEKVVAAIDEALIEFNDGTNCTECVFKDVCDDGYEGCVETMVSVCKNTVRKGGVE